MTIVWDDEPVIEKTSIVWDDEPVVKPKPVAVPAPEEERGLLGRSYDTAISGVSDAMSTMMGDTYGREDPTGSPLQRDELPIYNPIGSDRLTKALGGDLALAVGDIGGDLMMTAGKAVLPDAAQEAIASGAQYVMESEPAQMAGRGLEKAKEFLGPDKAALAGELLNIGAAIAPVPKIKPKFGAKSRVKLEKALQKRKTLETERLLEPNPNDMLGKGTTSEQGFMRSFKYEPGKAEARKAKLVSEIADVDPKRSNNYNQGVIQKEVKKLNTELVDELADVAPVSIENVTNSIDDAIDAARQTPNLAGEAGAMAETLSAHADRLLSKYKNADKTITPNNLLKVRRELDKWTEKYGPKDLYGDKGSALSDANDAIREALNSALSEAAPNAAVREKLWDMSDLIAAQKLTYSRGIPGKERGNRASRYLENLERATGVKHPVNPQSIAISASNPQVGIGAAIAALGIGAKNSAGRGLSRNRTAIMEMAADAIKNGSQGLPRAALIDLMNEEEKQN